MKVSVAVMHVVVERFNDGLAIHRRIQRFPHGPFPELRARQVEVDGLHGPFRDSLRYDTISQKFAAFLIVDQEKCNA